VDTLRLTTIFKDHFGSYPSLQVRAPGRVNLLGEHVDYNEGPVLPAAIDRAVLLAGSATNDNIVELYAPDVDEKVIFSLDTLARKQNLSGDPLPNWAHYPAGVAWALQQSGRQVCGIRVVYTSDVPIGAGLSSSAAVEMAFAVAWQAMGGWTADRLALAQICQKAENLYVGVACGLMDQFTSGHGVRDHALLFDTRSLEWEALPLPTGTMLVIADTRVRRNLASSAYNERRSACEKAVEILRLDLPNIHSLRDVTPDDFSRLCPSLPLEIRLRAEHVITEIQRVFSGAAALRSGDQDSFGELMFASHASLRDLYEVSTSELDALVAISRNNSACIGARLTGAGFGGCTINLIKQDLLDQFIQDLRKDYQLRTGRETDIYACYASQGASLMD
jgi:galactokinase